MPPASTYGFGFGSEGTRWGGFLADLVHVPFADVMVIPVPDGHDPEAAAGPSDNLVDAYRTVGPPLAERPGAPVLVVGGAGPGSIGLHAVAQALALGSEAVLYVDEDPRRRELAEGMGAETLDHIPPSGWSGRSRSPSTPAARRERCRSRCAASPATASAPFRRSTSATRRRCRCSRCTHKFTTLVTGRIHARRDAPRVLELLAGGAFDPTPVTTSVLAFDDAAAALSAHDHTKLVFVPFG